MQDLIEEVIRGIGYVSLKIATWGRYAGGGSADRLREGALGLVLIALVTYLIVRLSAVG